MDERISYNDLKDYEHLFTMTPSFVLKRMAKRNSNLIDRFRPTVESHLSKLNDEQKVKLGIILNSEVEDLQDFLSEAYMKTKIKQYKILADPKNRGFIELNLSELRKMI